MLKRIFITFFFVYIPVLSCLYGAGTTGRIVGRIVDDRTGEPLAGANVSLIGTYYGTASNSNGEFKILNVPVGSHTIQITYIGYQKYILKNIIVHIGLTSKLNIGMISEAVQTETVTVTADNPLIQKSATNATRIVTQEEIENLPVRGIALVAGLQPGMVMQDGDLHIRGGRADEVTAYIDGAQIRSVYSGQRIGNVIPEALAELQVQAGGYEAAYGGANSGIIAMAMREGTSHYEFGLRAETDRFAGENKQFFGTNSYGYSDLTFHASGPVPYTNDKIKFFVAVENQSIRDWYHRFWEAFTLRDNETVLEDGSLLQLEDTGNRSGLTGDSVDEITWGGGNTPNATADQWTYNSVVSADFKNIKLRLSALGGLNKVRENNMPITRIFNTDRLPVIEGSDITLIGKLTHILSANTFYELGASYHHEQFRRSDPYLKDNHWAYHDSLQNAAHGFSFLTYTLDPLDYDFYGFRFERPGHVISAYNHWKRSYIGGKLDFTHVHGRHTFQLGGDVQYWTLRSFTGFTHSGALAYLRANPDLISEQEDLDIWMRSQGVNTYGYDLLGNETDSGLDIFDRAKHPMTGAVYLQDKYEWQDLVLNMGLRVDFFDMDQWGPQDETNPVFNESTYQLDVSSWTNSDISFQLSPRLGLAFPVTDKSVFHFQWGRFIQMSQMSEAYWSQAYMVSVLQGNFFLTNPPAFIVRPEKTIQYEIGLGQMIGANASIDVTLFYKDIKDQLQTRRILTSTNAAIESYNLTQNGDYATTKGLELRLTMRRINRLMGWINYTYSDAKGTGSYVNQASASLDQGTNQVTIVSPLYFNQKHRGTVSLDFRFDPNEKSSVLRNSGINLLLNFNSGHPYTLSTGGVGQNDASQGAVLTDTDARGRRPLEPIGASTTPWNFTVDIRLDKTFQIGRFDMNFYVYATNLLNTRNIINVFPRTGTDNDGFLNDPNLSGKIIEAQGGAGYKKLYELINDQNRQHYLWEYSFRGNDIWSMPRQVRAGVKVDI